MNKLQSDLEIAIAYTMPEIVEVTVMAEQLDFHLSGRELLKITNLTGKMDLTPLVNDLPLKVESVFNKGKLACIVFVKGKKGQPTFEEDQCGWLFIQFGMTGGFRPEQETHSHLCFHMSESKTGFNEVFYTDVRRIGSSLQYTNDKKEAQERLDNIALPIALGQPTISLESFIKGIKARKNKFLATVLLDQKQVCSGIGNYIRSEALYRSELNPYVKCGELTTEQLTKLYTEISAIILESYNSGGVSVRDYKDIYGEEGKYSTILQVYSKKKDPKGNKVVSITGPDKRTIWYVKEKQGPIAEEYLEKSGLSAN